MTLLHGIEAFEKKCPETDMINDSNKLLCNLTLCKTNKFGFVFSAKIAKETEIKGFDHITK